MPRVTRSRSTVPALASLACALLLAVAATAAPPSQAKRPSGGNRAMVVNVLDKAQSPVAGLGAADFVVKEDGVSREVLSAEKASDPITLALLVDTSQAAEPYVADMRRALTAFVQKVGGKNLVTIMGFGERPTVLADYTRDVALLQKGVDRVFPAQGSGSYLLQAVDETCRTLGKRDAPRAVIVAITAGGAEFSERNFKEFEKILPPCGASVEILSFDTEAPNLSDWGQRNREQFIEMASHSTGGDRVSLLSSMALEPALDKLADQLANQYKVTYFHPDRLIPTEKVEVSVKRPGLTARGTPVKVEKG